MNFFILAFYWFSILSYFLILILPTQNRFLFSAILLLPLFLIFLKKAKSSFENIKKNSTFLLFGFITLSEYWDLRYAFAMGGRALWDVGCMGELESKG